MGNSNSVLRRFLEVLGVGTKQMRVRHLNLYLIVICFSQYAQRFD